jgi:hypothetical protein
VPDIFIVDCLTYPISILNQLGALRFDKDLRAVISYFSRNVHGPVRDKFTRLNQISMLLNLEVVGIDPVLVWVTELSICRQFFNFSIFQFFNFVFIVIGNK